MLMPSSPHGPAVLSGVALLCAAAIALGVTAPATGARQPPAFKSGVEVVQLSVGVRDPTLRVVSGLTAADFQVFEDGVQQQVAVFSSSPQPLALAVLVDVSASMNGDRRAAALAAVDIVARSLNEPDRWSVFTFADRTTLEVPWDRPDADLGRWRVLERTGRATRLFDAVREATDYLRDAPNRKRAILVISDGNDSSQQARPNYRATLEGMDALDDSGGRAERALRSGEALLYAFGMDWPYEKRRGPSERIDRVSLERLSGPTGGAVWMVRTLAQIQRAAEELVQELRQQYTLGYVPARPPDGQYRRIVVRTSNPANTVSHRLGYVAVPRPR